MNFTAAQSALFKVQLYHVRRALEAEKLTRRLQKYPDSPIMADAVRLHKRRAKLHRQFIDAITPFVLPASASASEPATS